MKKLRHEKQNLTWYYAHDADITIGEKKVSKAAKVALIALILALCALVVLGIYFRTYIYDYIVNPTINLNTSEVEIPVHSQFDPEKYILYDDERHPIEVAYPDVSDIDFDKLGEYTVYYTSKNSMKISKIPLDIKIVDNEPPKIELKTYLILLDREEAKKSFNPKDYIKDYSDNYTPKDKLDITWTKQINWDDESAKIDYIVTDGQGLQSMASLMVVLNDPPPHEHIWDDGTIIKEPTTEEEGIIEYKCKDCDMTKKVKIPKLPKHEKPKEPENPVVMPNPPVPTVPNNPTPEPPPPQPPQPVNPPAPAQPYINGVHDVTVKVGTSISDLVAKLTSGVSGSGSITVDYHSVNLTVAGSYTVTFKSSDGVTKTCTVTVVD